MDSLHIFSLPYGCQSLRMTLSFPPFSFFFCAPNFNMCAMFSSPITLHQVGFMPDDVRAICSINESKKMRHKGDKIGNKGIGFKSVFKVTATPQIHSRNFHFAFDARNEGMGFFLPQPLEAPATWNPMQGTRIRLPLTVSDKNRRIVPRNLSGALDPGSHAEFYKRLTTEVQALLLLFLNQLRSITVIDTVRKRTRTLRRVDLPRQIIELQEATADLLEDTSATTLDQPPSVSSPLRSKNEHCQSSQWLCITRSLTPSKRLQAEHMEGVLAGEGDACPAVVTKLSLALPWQLNSPLPPLEQQNVYAFLPLRSYGFHVIIQADWEIPAARESIDGASPWLVGINL